MAASPTCWSILARPSENGRVPTYSETDDYMRVMAEGVAAELANYSWLQTLEEQDQLLLDLIVAKNDKP